MRLKLAAVAGASALALLAAAPAHATTSPLDWALNTGSGAQPVYAVDNSNADVEIGTLNSSTHQFSLVATDVAGGSGASSSTFLRGDMTWAAPTSSCPAGSSTDVQYNNAGACAGNGSFTYDGSTVTFPDNSTHSASGIAALAGLQMAANHQITWASGPFGIVALSGSPGAARLDFKETSTTYGSLEENGGVGQWIAGTGAAAGTGAYCYGLSATQCMWNAGSTFALGATRAIFNFGSGTVDDASGQIGAGIGLFSAEIGTPDGGALGTAVNQFVQPIVADPSNSGVPSNPPANSLAHTIGMYPVGNFYLGAGLGALIGGSGNSDTNITNFSTCLSSQDGFPNLCFEMGSAGENHKVTVGYNRIDNAFGTNTSALYIGDLVGPANSINSLSGGLGGSNITVAPTVTFSGGCTAVANAVFNPALGTVVGYYMYQPGINSSGGDCAGATVTLSGGGVGATLPSNPTVNLNVGNKPGPGLLFNALEGEFVGFGQDSLSTNSVVSTRLCGAADNYGAPGVWDDEPANQPTCGMPGGLAFGTGTNVAPPGGTLTYTEQLRDSGGTNILALTTPGLSGTFTVGLKLGFERLVPVTVAGLSTADPSPSAGDRATVTDATACTFNSAVTGGSSTKCPVYYDGSAWRAA